MDRERLAAYVAGELEADERAEIEARLARDPALRAEVARLERAQAALAALPPATPPEGFEQRLADHVSPVLDEVLGRAPGGVAPGPDADPELWVAAGDELAARRRSNRWVPAVMGAAAAVVLLGVAGVALQGLSAGDRDEAALDVTSDAEEAELHASGADGPTVLATDRDVDGEQLDELADEATLTELRDRRLGVDDGRRVAGDYTAQLRAGAGTARAEGPPDQRFGDGQSEETTADDAAPEEETDADVEAGGGDAADEVVARCLDVLLDGAGDPAPIPAYVELLRFEGEPAVAYALLTPGAAGAAYDRVELWVVDRVDCQVLQLRQHDAG